VPEELELRRSELAQAVEVRPTVDGADVQELEAGEVETASTRERQDLHQLQLIQQVVLEPEDDVASLRQGFEQHPVTPFELGEDRRLVLPALPSEEPRTGPEEVRTSARQQWTFVGNVAPGKDGPLDTAALDHSAAESPFVTCSAVPTAVATGGL